MRLLACVFIVHPAEVWCFDHVYPTQIGSGRGLGQCVRAPLQQRVLDFVAAGGNVPPHCPPPSNWGCDHPGYQSRSWFETTIRNHATWNVQWLLQRTTLFSAYYADRAHINESIVQLSGVCGRLSVPSVYVRTDSPVTRGQHMSWSVSTRQIHHLFAVHYYCCCCYHGTLCSGKKLIYLIIRTDSHWWSLAADAEITRRSGVYRLNLHAENNSS